MPRHTPIAFLFIVGLLFVDITHADELVSSSVEPASTQPRSFIIDFDSASIETRQAHGADLDAPDLLEVRAAVEEIVLNQRGRVKGSRLVIFDPAAFDPGFFDGPIFLDFFPLTPCVAHPIEISEEPGGSIQWIGRCDSSTGSAEMIGLNVNFKEKQITGFVKALRQYFVISTTPNKPLHVILEHDPNYVPDKPSSD